MFYMLPKLNLFCFQFISAMFVKISAIRNEIYVKLIEREITGLSRYLWYIVHIKRSPIKNE